MSQKHKTYFNWSSGKDAALALFHLQKNKNFNIDKLLTSINSFHNRVSMHGLRKELLLQQVKEVGLPISFLELPEQPTMEFYNQQMETLVEDLRKEGYTHTGFGDIFLEDLRAYREKQLNELGIECIFPLWKRDSKTLIREFLNLGFRAIVICIKSELLDQSFVGREIDEKFLEDLPANVDPCGENGEFHTFCFDGPIFKNPIRFKVGEKVFREYKLNTTDNAPKSKNALGFWFCDLILETD